MLKMKNYSSEDELKKAVEVADYLQSIIPLYESNFSEVGKLDNSLGDIMHEIELLHRDMWGQAKKMKKVQEIRKHRRDLKDQNVMLFALYTTLKKHPGFLADLRNNLLYMKQRNHYLKGRVYTKQDGERIKEGEVED